LDVPDAIRTSRIITGTNRLKVAGVDDLPVMAV
jgi:hypothetical protein